MGKLGRPLSLSAELAWTCTGFQCAQRDTLVRFSCPTPPHIPYGRIASLKRADEFAAYIARLGLALGFDRELMAGERSPLGQSYLLGKSRIGNRFCILPMEGWDGTEDGRPSELTFRRWRHFGESGAKLIWGGEAVAVSHDGRANPNQLLIERPHPARSTALRRRLVVGAPRNGSARADDLLVGLQLTHSGRFARPNDKKRLEPRILSIIIRCSTASSASNPAIHA